MLQEQITRLTITDFGDAVATPPAAYHDGMQVD